LIINGEKMKSKPEKVISKGGLVNKGKNAIT